MFVKINNVRIDTSDISKYYPYADSLSKIYRLYFFFKGSDENENKSHSVYMNSEEELNTIIEYLDKAFHVNELIYIPEKEVTKSQLIINQK